MFKSCTIELPPFVILTGENGTGKSTLLDSISRKDTDVTVMSETGRALTKIAWTGPGLQLAGLTLNPGLSFLDHKNRWNELKPLANFSDTFLELNPYSDMELNDFKEKIYQLASVVFPGNNSHPNWEIFTRENFATIANLCNLSGRRGKDLEFHDYFAFTNISSNILGTSISFIFHQFLIKKIYYPYLVQNEPAPWDVFDELMSIAGFKYTLAPFSKKEVNELVQIKLRNKEGGLIVELNDLSSGERTILSLIVMLYNADVLSSFPEVLLLDEPDAFLHPSLADSFLKVVQEFLVEKKGINIIMTTHSPSTVALAPDQSIFIMDQFLGYPRKEDKNKAIRSLTKGLTTLNVSLQNRKQIFTEAEADQFFYEKIVEKLIAKGELVNDQMLLFISAGGTNNSGKSDPVLEDAGCDRVKTLTNQMHKFGNNQIYGLIDWDKRNSGNNKVIVFAAQTRYSIENFIYDPLFLACYALIDNREKSRFGLDDSDDYHDIKNFTLEKIQILIDTISDAVFEKMEWRKENEKSKGLVDVTLLNQMTVKMPKWYLETGGHQIYEACKNAYKTLESMRTSKEFILKCVLPNYLFLPIEVKKTFQTLQSLSTVD